MQQLCPGSESLENLIRGGSAREEHGDSKPASPSEQLQVLLSLKTWLWCILVVLVPHLRMVV